MVTSFLHSFRRLPWNFLAALVLPLLMLHDNAYPQERLERDELVLHWGLVPAATVSRQHSIADLHGGPPATGGKINHLVLALFDAKTGLRIEDAVVRAQLIESGIVDEAAKEVPVMSVDGVVSYGQFFGMVRDGPYRFRILVKLPQRPGETEFTIEAMPQLRGR